VNRIATRSLLVAVGRVTAGIHAPHDASYRAGYSDGIQIGEAQGRQEGRAEQEGAAASTASASAAENSFNDGYAAGDNDAFSGYDGGWALATPYIVTLQQGTGPIVYRFASRAPLQPGIDYYLCAHGVCQQARN
jgi:hypothetical protein